MTDTTSELPLGETQRQEFHTKVTESLKTYDEIEPGLRDRVRDYLVEGGDASCLLELAAAYQNEDRKRFFKQRHGITQATDRVERKRLYGLFQIDRAAPGYYRRLGEVAGQVPEVQQAGLASDALVSSWLADMITLQWLLCGDPYAYYGAGIKEPTFPVRPYLADLEDPAEIATLIAMVVESDSSPFPHISRFLCRASDWSAILTEHPAELAAALKAAPAASREMTLTWLISLKHDFSGVLPAVAEMAVGSSKKVRPIALNILRDFPEQAGELLADRLAEGTASERCWAAEALVAIAGADAEPRLAAAVEGERAKRVRQTIQSLLTGLEAAADGGQGDWDEPLVDLPPVETPSGELPLPDGFADALREQLGSAFDMLEQQYRRMRDVYDGPERSRYMQQPRRPERTSEAEFARVLSYVSGQTAKRPRISNWTRQAATAMVDWSKWADLTKLHLAHVVRFLDAFQFASPMGPRSMRMMRDDLLETHRAAQEQPYGLREVAAAFSTLPHFDRGAVATAYLENNSWHSFLDWEAEAVWPLFVEQTEIFRDAILGVGIQKNDYKVSDRRRMAMRVAATMPRLASDVELALWSVALGEGKTDRPAARKALHAARNRPERALAAVGDGKQAIRIAGAEMLAEIGDPAAIVPLKKALQKEKQEIVKGALLQAIEQLGGDVDEFLGRRKQLADAKKGLQKRRPKGMEWVPLDALPQVRWAEDDKPVAPEIVQWWVVQSIQFKLPACGAVLRRSAAMCRRDDFAALARRLLADWTAYDTKAPSREEVLAEATKQASQHWNSKHNHWLKEYYKTEENYRDELARQMQNTFLQSAIGQKGLLAIVSAGGDAQCVKMIERYIRTYHGNRLAQSKALLETLAWIEDPTAVQLLLSLGNRFRTKAIRKRAAQIVQELADRQGWTMDQLADRTIPDAGFARQTDDEGNPIDERAELRLDYGSRSFSVVLNDDLQPVITRQDGKQVKSLPAAAKDDDPELVKAAKKEFSAAKKTVKEVVKSLGERLYEAACVQRSWPADQWRKYLARHPIAAALCRRVVWAAQSPDESEPPRLFRPLEDGSLTDVNDDEFALHDNDRVLVAHSSLLDEQTEEAWKQHLLDYEVPQLFRQFGRQTFRLPDGLAGATDIEDFRGHMLTTFRLRSRATKLGWVRGDAMDGGCFTDYHKPFRGQQVDAVVEFSGSYLPEEDIPAAIVALYFVPIQPNDDAPDFWSSSKLKLGKVPAVLVSECYNDVREMAAEGSGYDPDWQKKGLW